ncbi:polyadenylate-binding protein 4-like [Eutrema salsugineum]|uniref:polyadenylate-binding protein 4-like n=1 Tax=Eutrema salsugineum TaxID=72664 RepID=UPI000CED5D4C|nr:polyadenylate-binding protein 4-like [Eutrema salsugineum]
MAKANPSRKRKPEDNLETKPVLKQKSEEKETPKGSVQMLETKSDQPNLISVKETVEGLDDETPDFVEAASVRKKTLFVGRLSPQTGISDIIDFFKDIGQVVRVRLVVDRKCISKGYGFVEFASANEAKKALQEKNGEYLHVRKINLDDVGATYFPPMYCIDHKVWYEDYLQRVSLPIREDETPPNFVEDVLFIANLSPHTTKILDIIDFFEDVGEVVSVRLVVDSKGKNVGYGFVEFASANLAKRALESKNGEYLHDHKILLMKGLNATPDPVEKAAVRKKTLFVDCDVDRVFESIEISDIIDFFKDVGKVVHVRLMVDPRGRHVCGCYVEFASSYEAEKALREKNGEYLHDLKISLDVVHRKPPNEERFCIDYNIRYEDYLRRESLVIGEVAAVEGLDETPDFDEEIAVRNKTLFASNFSRSIRITNIIKYFRSAAKVVRVRLPVDQWGRRLGCAFVEFASANEAKKALEEKNRRAVFLGEAEIVPYPFRLKYNHVEKLWYQDCLRRFSIYFKTKQKKKEITFSGTKITFSDDD